MQHYIFYQHGGSTGPYPDFEDAKSNAVRLLNGFSIVTQYVEIWKDEKIDGRYSRVMVERIYREPKKETDQKPSLTTYRIQYSKDDGDIFKELMCDIDKTPFEFLTLPHARDFVKIYIQYRSGWPAELYKIVDSHGKYHTISGI